MVASDLDHIVPGGRPSAITKFHSVVGLLESCCYDCLEVVESLADFIRQVFRNLQRIRIDSHYSLLEQLIRQFFGNEETKGYGGFKLPCPVTSIRFSTMHASLNPYCSRVI